MQDGACQSGVSPIFDRTKEKLCSSDTGIAMTRRILLEALGAYRDHGTKPKGVTDPDVFMVRAVSLRLPPERPGSMSVRHSCAPSSAPISDTSVGERVGTERADDAAGNRGRVKRISYEAESINSYELVPPDGR